MFADSLIFKGLIPRMNLFITYPPHNYLCNMYFILVKYLYHKKYIMMKSNDKIQLIYLLNSLENKIKKNSGYTLFKIVKIGRTIVGRKL